MSQSWDNVAKTCNMHELLTAFSVYSGTPLNGHLSMADTCDVTDNSECLNCISIDFNVFKPPQQWTPRYSV